MNLNRIFGYKFNQFIVCLFLILVVLDLSKIQGTESAYYHMIGRVLRHLLYLALL